MFKKSYKKIFLKDNDILHSLNFNIFLNSRECVLQDDKIVYCDYRKFNYKEELNGYYQKKDKEIFLYVSKLDKIMQLLNNIFLYLNLPKEKLLFRVEKNIIYINIYKLVEIYNTKTTFDFITFFKKFSWIKDVKKTKDNLLQIEIIDKNFLIYRFNIIEEKFFVITASRKENEFIIINPIDKIIKIGIKLSYY